MATLKMKVPEIPRNMSKDLLDAAWPNTLMCQE